MTLIGSSHARPCRICGVSGCACGGPTATRGVDPLNPEEIIVSNKGEPVHEYDVTTNGYDTIMNLTEAEAENYPGAKKRSGPVAPDHPDHENNRRDDDRDDESGKHSSSGKARNAPNK